MAAANRVAAADAPDAVAPAADRGTPSEPDVVADWYATELAEIVALDAGGIAGLHRHHVRRDVRDVDDVGVPNLLTIAPPRLRRFARR